MDYLFTGPENEIPLDGLPTYMESIWDKIRNDKDLDIPSQKQLLANLRCGELKQQSLVHFSQISEQLFKEANEGYYPDFGIETTQLINEALEVYDENGRRYHPVVY
mmetsp:Transcript_7917/g.1055  ORF Transcript_7917/g.1055 Transcript_7917/m.1055 type:complete len:106 (+) Transcript_7917:726-1043(+)